MGFAPPVVPNTALSANGSSGVGAAARVLVFWPATETSRAFISACQPQVCTTVCRLAATSPSNSFAENELAKSDCCRFGAKGVGGWPGSEGFGLRSKKALRGTTAPPYSEPNTRPSRPRSALDVRCRVPSDEGSDAGPNATSTTWRKSERRLPVLRTNSVTSRYFSCTYSSHESMRAPLCSYSAYLSTPMTVEASRSRPAT